MSQANRVHAIHVLPLKIYFGVAAALMFFTVVTYLVSLQDFGSLNLFVALAIAFVKASLVGLYFMHLRYDNKIYATILVASLLFLTIFIVLTMFDTLWRGGIYDIKSHPIRPNAAMYDNMKSTTHEGAGSANHFVDSSTAVPHSSTVEKPAGH